MNKIARELVKLAKSLVAGDVALWQVEKALQKAGFRADDNRSRWLSYFVEWDNVGYQIKIVLEDVGGMPEKVIFTSIPTDGRAHTYKVRVKDFGDVFNAIQKFWKKKTGLRFGASEVEEVEEIELQGSTPVKERKQKAADELPSDRELEKFYDYVMKFYGSRGLYPMVNRNRPLNKRDVMKATWKLLKSRHDWGGGDSFDREKVRDILLDGGYEMADE